MRMMMKKSIIALAALALLAWGCSSDDEGVSPMPTPTPPEEKTTVIEPGNDARPDWAVPNADDYEQNMNVYLTLQDELQPYLSQNDLLCAKADDKVRGVAIPRQDEGDWLISLIVFSNGAVPLQLSYYCDSLHRIFTLNDWTTFDASVTPTGSGGIYQPVFVK